MSRTNFNDNLTGSSHPQISDEENPSTVVYGLVFYNYGRNVSVKDILINESA